MAQKKASYGLRAWYEHQTQLQADGSYLVRPGRHVYQVDAATRRRWITFQLWYPWLTLLALSWLFNVIFGDSWAWPIMFLFCGALPALLLAMLHAGRLLFFRRAQHVAPDRWQGPPVVVRDNWQSLSAARWHLLSAGGLTLLFVVFAISSNASLSLWQRLAPLLMFAVLLVLAAFTYRSVRQHPAEASADWPDRTARPPRHRTWLAMLIAPSAMALFGLVGEFTGAHDLPLTQRLGFLLWWAADSYALSYTVGLPIYLLARWRGWRTWVDYIGGGFLIGAGAVAITEVFGSLVPRHGLAWLLDHPLLLLVSVALAPNQPAYLAPGLALLIGGFTFPIGLLFWLIARPDRPA